MLIDRRYFRYFDWINFFLTISLLSLGLLFVFSSTYTPEKQLSPYFKKQLIGAISGISIYLFFCLKDLRSLARFGYFAYFFSITLLFYAHVAGWIAMGAKRWVPLYFIKGQPSELVKLFLPSFIAICFSEQKEKNKLLFPLIMLTSTCLLILRQPDLGTATLIFSSGIILLWFVGIDKKFFLVLGLISFLGAPFFWKVLRPYQQQRIMVLLGHGDSQKERYQIEQSKIAIGSGGIYGKGLLKGTQNKLSFLPENHTDFIFSVICEEWGFVGATLVIVLFILLFFRLLFITIQVIDPMMQIISLGLIIHIMLSVCINIGMVTGILPTVGISLPLFSCGISNLWVTLASLGWLNNIAIRRFYY